MARLPRATFALMLALLPATASLTCVVVLPSLAEVGGVALVVLAVAVHRPLRPSGRQ